MIKLTVNEVLVYEKIEGKDYEKIDKSNNSLFRRAYNEVRKYYGIKQIDNDKVEDVRKMIETLTIKKENQVGYEIFKYMINNYDKFKDYVKEEEKNRIFI